MKCKYCDANKAVGFIGDNEACINCINYWHDALGLHKTTRRYLLKDKEGN